MYWQARLTGIGNLGLDVIIRRRLGWVGVTQHAGPFEFRMRRCVAPRGALRHLHQKEPRPRKLKSGKEKEEHLGKKEYYGEDGLQGFRTI